MYIANVYNLLTAVSICNMRLASVARRTLCTQNLSFTTSKELSKAM